MLNFLSLPLQFFSADNGGGNGDPAPGQPGGQEPNNNNEPPQPGTGDQTPPGEKVFKQEDVNNIVAKEAKKAQEKLLKQLGVEDFENAKEGLSKFKEWQESQKTEAERQADRLKTLETEKNTLSDENTSLKAQLSALKAGVKTESVEDVVVLAKNLISDDVDMDAAIKRVVEKYPQFAQGEQQGPEEKKPSFTTGQHQKGGLTKNVAEMSYQELVDLKSSNPAKFAELTKQ